MKTALVHTMMHGDQEKKDHCNMYTGILFFLCHICSMQKLRSKAWDFLYRSFVFTNGTKHNHFLSETPHKAMST
jgi:hypothetical protein